MTTAARAVWGRSCSSELKTSSSSTTTPAPTRPVTWLFAPACSATAVREPLVEMAKPWKNPAAMFDAPMPTISWLGSISSPRRAAKAVAVAIVSVSDTSVMPSAATKSGTRSLVLGPWHRRRRNTLGQWPGHLDAHGGESEHGGDDGGTDHGDEHGRDLLGEAGQHEQEDEHRAPEEEGPGVGLVEVGDELTDLVDEAVGVGGEAEELGELADDDRDAEAVHVADLHLLREQVGDEAELSEAEADLDEPDHDRHHPGQCDGLARVTAGNEQRGDRGEDQRRHRRIGTEHQHAGRPEDGVADQAGDGRVEARDRR